jgi:hypothetical protein
MIWLKGETGASPVLSRNCNTQGGENYQSPEVKPGRPPGKAFTTDLAERRWGTAGKTRQIPARFHLPVQFGQGVAFKCLFGCCLEKIILCVFLLMTKIKLKWSSDS